ncbi:conserved hypothetical protein [Neospora caninum Liverpool]|uniref:Uncharacterized protein n=1 Tax=Neospora caninum (strain Liverpool) TaxID=572307 RepID=F0VGJ9_NEOCL|nr:conserved hypothetical protein [Neospora caninum Liverpool]CBZ52843.1 conserved hypothetical protein [Neospora caninum Liverpool]|eukprot:XP_003882875.1 conserved hypothetical protein [Neospora caninum Liverpool]
MEPRELRNAVADCARRQIRMKELWDAFLYRAVVLRADLRPEHVAKIFHSLATVQKPVLSFIDYMLEDVRFRVHLFRLQDIALLLSALARLQVRDDLLLQALVPVILKRITPASPPKDLALVMHAFVRMEGPQVELLGSRVVASLAGRLEALSQPQSLALLLSAFAEHAKKQIQREALEKERERGVADAEDGRRASSEPAETGAAAHELGDLRETPLRIPFRVFLESLLEQTGRQLRDFHARDCVHTLAGVASLAGCNRRIREDSRRREEAALLRLRDEEAKAGRGGRDASKGTGANDGGEDGNGGTGETRWEESCLSPSLLEDVLWRVHKRLLEVKFEMQSRDAVLLFRSVHALQADCGEFTTETEELIKLPRPLDAGARGEARSPAGDASPVVSGCGNEGKRKKRRRPLLERLRDVVVQEATHRAGDLETTEVLELLRILASETEQFYPGLEAALCVRLSDSLVGFSSPYFKPPVELHKALQQTADIFLRLFSSAKPHLPPSFSGLPFSLAARSPSERDACGGLRGSFAISLNQEDTSSPRLALEHSGRNYRFAGAIGTSFFKLLAKQREMKLTPQVAATVTWALGVFHIRDPHWATTLKHRRASVVSCFTGNPLFPSSASPPSSASSSSSSLSPPSRPSSSGESSESTSSGLSSVFLEEEEADQLQAYLQGAKTLSKLAGGLALLGMSDVADCLGIFPLLSTVDTFGEPELPLSILMAAAVFDLTRRPATLANSLLQPAAEAVYNQREALPPWYSPSLRFISMSSLPSAWPAFLQDFFANPDPHVAAAPTGLAQLSLGGCWIAPHLSRLGTHDMLLRTEFIQSERLRKGSRRGSQVVHRSQQFDAIVGRYLNKAGVSSLLYRPAGSDELSGDAPGFRAQMSGESRREGRGNKLNFDKVGDDTNAEEHAAWGGEESLEGEADETPLDAETDLASVSDRFEGDTEEDEGMIVFPERVRKELLSWQGVHVACEVQVGPFVVPFAVDLVSLGEHLKRFPLRAAKKTSSSEESLAEESLSLDEVREEETATGTPDGSREEAEAADRKYPRAEDAPRQDEQKSGDLEQNAAHAEGGKNPEGPNPRTHILLDVLWRDFDFYLEPHSGSTPASFPSSAPPARGPVQAEDDAEHAAKAHAEEGPSEIQKDGDTLLVAPQIVLPRDEKTGNDV